MTTARSIQPINNLMHNGAHTANIYSQKQDAVDLIEIPDVNVIAKDQPLYIKGVMEYINTIRKDDLVLFKQLIPQINGKIDTLSHDISKLNQDINTRFDMLSNQISQHNQSINIKIDTLSNDINIRFDEISEAWDTTSQLLRTEVVETINNKLSVANELSNPLRMSTTLTGKKSIQRGSYKDQLLDDETLGSLNEQELVKLRSNITSTKSRCKESFREDKDETMAMCNANIEKINERIKYLRSMK